MASVTGRYAQSLVALATLLAVILGGIPARLDAALPVHHAFEGAGELDKGELKDVSLSDLGRLTLAPRVIERGAFAQEVVVWSLARGPDGTVYAGTGHDGLVMRAPPGKPFERMATTEDMLVTALAVDRAGTLYAGTSPRGRIVKVIPGGIQPILDTHEHYVWALAVGKDGTIYAGLGPRALLIAVSPAGASRTLIEGSQRHICSLAVADDGTIYAGTEPEGLVYVITPGARPRVLFKAPQPEIRALALTADGIDVLATTAKKGAGIGADISTGARPPMGLHGQPGGAPPQPHSAAKSGHSAPTTPPESEASPSDALSAPPSFHPGHGLAPSEPSSSPASSEPTPTASTAQGPAESGSPPSPAPPPPFMPPGPMSLPPGAPGPGKPPHPVAAVRFGPVGPDGEPAVYHVTRDGVATQILTASQSVLLSMCADSKGRLWVGSGHEGIVYRIDGDRIERLVKLTDAQVMALCPDGDRMLAATGNPARVVAIGDARAAEGSFISESQALGTLSWLGTAIARGERPEGTNVDLWLRTGVSSHPDQTWSDWCRVDHPLEGGQVAAPPGRWVQVKLALTSSRAPQSPEIREVDLISQSINVAPRVVNVEVTMPTVELTSEPRDPADREAAKVQLKKKYESGSIRHLKWEATDANEDLLVFRLFYRGASETEWHSLNGREMWASTLDWDTSDLADGYYVIKVVASDAPSNPAGKALTAERTSEPFLVDNNPPDLVDLAVSAAADHSVKVTGHAKDAASNVANIEIALDEHDFQLVPPDDGIADSPQEGFTLTLPSVPSGPHAITLKVYDDLGNVRIERRTVTVP